jgi:hypothetical protein
VAGVYLFSDIMKQKYQIGDLVKVKEDAVQDWDDIMELYDVDPRLLGLVIEVTTDDLGNHYYGVLFTTKTLRFDHNELVTV